MLLIVLCLFNKMKGLVTHMQMQANHHRLPRRLSCRMWAVQNVIEISLLICSAFVWFWLLLLRPLLVSSCTSSQAASHLFCSYSTYLFFMFSLIFSLIFSWFQWGCAHFAQQHRVFRLYIIPWTFWSLFPDQCWVEAYLVQSLSWWIPVSLQTNGDHGVCRLRR